jgi:hypothetical protein
VIGVLLLLAAARGSDIELAASPAIHEEPVFGITLLAEQKTADEVRLSVLLPGGNGDGPRRTSV